VDQSLQYDNSAAGCCGSAPGNSSCCTENAIAPAVSEPWVIGSIDTPNGKIPQVATKLTIEDTLGSWKARWGINRMNYKVTPGLYGVGAANHESPVLVTANYKLSFDMLRRELAGINAWILVLDTKGINVWCAAGKGTFGTDELVNRIAVVNLDKMVSHKKLVLPQLGAPGISAHQVQKRSGFKVAFGPVRAADLKEYLAAGMKATAAMRKVRFSTYDRLVLTPIELVATLKPALMILGVLFILNLLRAGSFGVVDFYAYLGALLVGCVLVPVLLPWIPGKAFAWKGWLMGLFWALGVNVLNGWPANPDYGTLRALAYILVLPAISGFYAMNFTGASTYTSPSGVLKEMRIALPAIIISLGIGVVLLLIAAFSPGL